jgi:murein DD-endopeptidase MepM/ murein hydrolase activator NlpD
VLCGVLASCVLFFFTALYAAGGLQAAKTLELVPFIGAELGPRVEAWVLGSTEELTIYDSPIEDGDLLTQTVGVPYTGTVEARPECKQPKGWPLRGYITQGFHAGHKGIDISVVSGSMVQTTMCGTVIFAGQPAVDGFGSEGYGNLMIVANSEYKTYYAHLSEMYYMPGDEVDAGLIIAASGNTGRSTGAHLHYEVWVDGKREDPWPYMQLGEGEALMPVLSGAAKRAEALFFVERDVRSNGSPAYLSDFASRLNKPRVSRGGQIVGFA